MLAESDELVTDRWTLPTTPVTRTEPRVWGGGGGALGYFLGGYVPPGTPLAPRSKKISRKIDTRSRNGPIFYTPFEKVCKLK